MFEDLGRLAHAVGRQVGRVDDQLAQLRCAEALCDLLNVAVHQLELVQQLRPACGRQSEGRRRGEWSARNSVKPKKKTRVCRVHRVPRCLSYHAVLSWTVKSRTARCRSATRARSAAAAAASSGAAIAAIGDVIEGMMTSYDRGARGATPWRFAGHLLEGHVQAHVRLSSVSESAVGAVGVGGRRARAGRSNGTHRTRASSCLAAAPWGAAAPGERRVPTSPRVRAAAGRCRSPWCGARAGRARPH